MNGPKHPLKHVFYKNGYFDSQKVVSMETAFNKVDEVISALHYFRVKVF